jgi:hypothetical protein
MSAITTMARFLEEELQARGVAGLSREDCVEILRATIDRTAEAADKIVAKAAAATPAAPPA